MQKIVIIGPPGAGKSTFAQILGNILDIEVIHLDRYFWQPGWKEYPRKARIAIQQQLVRGKDRWIIEGTYLGSSDSRLEVADTIIFLDMPRLVCLWRAIKRHITYRGYSRLDIPDGCTDRLSLLYILKVLVFPHKGRKWLLAKIKEIRAEEANELEKKTILTYSSRDEVEYFLRECLPNCNGDMRIMKNKEKSGQALIPETVAILALGGR
jgi:adenylate kinase family enzyme